MKTKTIVTAMTCFLFLAAAGPVSADDDAVRTMARITKNLNHYPSDADKEELASIAGSSDSSQHEITVARAMSRIQHRVSDADKAPLEAVMNDETAAADLRELAGVLLDVNHTPGDAAVAKLDAIIGG